ncbi:MAG: hypothetical protein WCT36_01315 [Candidatus Gracilibacteria bacterium]
MQQLIRPADIVDPRNPYWSLKLAMERHEATDSDHLMMKVRRAIGEFVREISLPEGLRDVSIMLGGDRFDGDGFVGHILLKRDGEAPKSETDVAAIEELIAHLKSRMPFAAITSNVPYGLINMVVTFDNFGRLFEAQNTVRAEKIRGASGDVANAVKNVVLDEKADADGLPPAYPPG